MLSIATKLHILLILTVVGIALYMYLLYKEVKIFQDELVVIKGELTEIKSRGINNPITASISNNISKPVIGEQQPPLANKLASVVAVASHDSECFDDEDDNESVTSNEIKNILTNIHDDDVDVEDVADVEDIEDVSIVREVHSPEDVKSTDKVTLSFKSDSLEFSDFSMLSEEELNTVTYDKLRAYLRSTGNSTVGNKAELVKRTLGLGNRKSKVV